MPDAPEPTAASEPRHRSDGARSRRRVIVAVVAALVLAGVGTGFLLTRPDHKKATAAPPTTSTHVRPPSPSPTPTPTPTPKKTKPPKPKIPHEVVKASGPKTFLFEGPHFNIKAHVCAMADIRPLDPPGEQEHTVCWVYTDDGFGGNPPGSNSATTYVLGHAWAENPQEVLNQISVPATKEILSVKPKYVDGVAIYPVKGLNGSMITLWTPTAKLKYKVRTVYGVDKNQAGSVKSLMDNSIMHRIVIITCAERNGVDYHYNVILYAYLYSSQKRTPTT